MHFLIAEAEAGAIGDRGFLDAHALARLVGIDHALLLGTDLAAQDGVFAGPERRLVDVELIRIDRALDDHLAETIAAGDKHRITEPGFGIEGEQDAGGTDIRAHHELHARRQRYILVLETVVHAVGDRAIVVQRGEDFLECVDDVIGTADIEEGFLLAGKRGIGQVFGGGRGAHGDGDIRAAGALAKLRIGFAHGLVEFGDQGGFNDPAADFGTGRGQFGDVVDIQRGQAILDALGKPALRDELLECRSGGGIAARHGNAELAQVADHLAERGVLATDLAKIGQAQRIQPKNQVAQDASPEK